MKLLATFKNMKKTQRDGIIGIAILVVILIASFVASDAFLDFMARAVIFMLFASALNIILGFGGLRPLGMAMYFGLGSYSYVIMCVRLGVPNGLAVLLAILISMVISLFINWLCLRAGDDLAFAFMSMGINTLLWTMVQKLQWVGSDTGITGNVRFAFFNGPRGNFYLCFVVCAICIILIYLLFRSPFATVLKGSRDNIERLTFVGMNTRNVRLYACMISSFFVTIAGILYAMRNMGAFPVMLSTNTSTEGLVMCLIGGMYSFFGPILGAVIVTVINVLLPNATRYYQFALGVIIVLCVLFLQGGLLRDKASKDLEENTAFEREEEAGGI